MEKITAGLLLGAAFGMAARWGNFCLLRGVRGQLKDQDSAPLRAFALAMAVGLLASQALQAMGSVDLATALPMRAQFSLVGVLLGGLLFGLGMVLANSCGARALVLLGGGNLRSLVVLVCLGLAAQATLTGVLAPLRTQLQTLGVVSPPAPDLAQAMAQWLGWALGPTALWTAGLLALALAGFALRPAPGRNTLPALASAAVIGLLVAAGWWITAHVGADPFDPLPLTSLSFVAPTGDSLLYLMLSTGRPADFGVALVAGTCLGALALALAGKTFRIESFTSTPRLLAAIAGGVCMGFGGVLALGCSIGQGLAGFSTLALASFAALAAIVAGIALGLAAERQLSHYKEAK